MEARGRANIMEKMAPTTRYERRSRIIGYLCLGNDKVKVCGLVVNAIADEQILY